MINKLKNHSALLPAIAFGHFGNSFLSRCIPDGPYLKCAYWIYMHRKLNLDNPIRFNEKLQWLIIHDHNPLYTTLVDKYRVKQWVADRIGKEHVTKTYAMWERAEDIDISELPERFVLKTNHDSGGVAVCQNRETFDLEKAKKKLAKHLKINYFWRTREWPYKNVKPCVFAEEYLDPTETNGDLVDYKFYCFGGEPRIMFTCTGRAAGDTRFDFFDMDFNHLDIKQDFAENADMSIDKPCSFNLMAESARKLSAGIPHVRIDFYEVDGRMYFGECTFFDASGFGPFEPEEWDERLGAMIDLTAVSSVR